jgi:uncharacterized protein (DUF2062 family)
MEREKMLDRIKARALAAADRVPLPVHFLLNAGLALVLAGDILLPDTLPFLDEALTAVGFYYYNMYILHRILGRMKAGRRTRNSASSLSFIPRPIPGP